MVYRSVISSYSEINNIFENTLIPLNQRHGFQSDVLPVYFSLYLGIRESESIYSNLITNYVGELKKINCPFITFDNNIPTSKNSTLTNCVKSVFKTIGNQALKSPNSIFEELLKFNETKEIRKHFPFFLDTITLYIKGNKNVSETQLKNFLFKLFNWFEEHLVRELNSFLNNINNSVCFNPVIIYLGNIKSHGEYFLYLCSLLGFDVVFINPDKGYTTPLLSKFGQKLEFNLSNSNFVFPDLSDISVVEPINNRSLNKVNEELDLLPAIINYRATDNIFLDLTTRISDRSGFIRGDNPFFPIYFYRVIGITSDYNNYFNNLFKLDRTLRSKHKGYIKFDGNIPLENDVDFIKSFSQVWKKYQTSNLTDLKNLLHSLGESKKFPNGNDKIKKRIILAGLHNTLLEFIADSDITSVGQIKNFVMKLLLWTKQHLSEAYELYDFNNLNPVEVNNPKILYYGDIKKHESYFLLYSSRLGIDVVYFNTLDDKTISKIVVDDLKDYRFEYDEKCRIQPFPTKEIITRTETTAYQASKEIEAIIFNPEDGLFKPWQLDPFKIKPVSLRSTFEETKILWSIEGRLRDKFEVKEDTVYLPNLFFKLNGVSENINDYWNLISTFNDQPLVKLIEKLPFSSEDFTKTDQYIVNYVMDSEGLLNLKEVKKKQIYKYSHLKDSTQNLILNKINEVLSSKAFKETLDKKKKEIIILTLLNLDIDILNLIASFDRPFVIPKLIIFDPDQSMFNKADVAIILFLHLIGFDIGIFTPTGYNNLENEINSNFFDIYGLESLGFDLTLPNLESLKTSGKKGKSFFASLFK